MSIVDKAAMKKGGPMMAYTGRLRPGLRYMKGSGSLSIGSLKGPKRANR